MWTKWNGILCPLKTLQAFVATCMMRLQILPADSETFTVQSEWSKLLMQYKHTCFLPETVTLSHVQNGWVSSSMYKYAIFLWTKSVAQLKNDVSLSEHHEHYQSSYLKWTISFQQLLRILYKHMPTGHFWHTNLQNIEKVKYEMEQVPWYRYPTWRYIQE